MSETALKCENYAIYQSKLYSRTFLLLKQPILDFSTHGEI